MTTAVVTSDVAAITRDVHQALLALRDAESREARLEKNIETAREVTARRRLDLGKELVRARALWPARGPKAKGWGDFLTKLGLDQPRAWEMMKLAGYVEEISSHSDETQGRVPTLTEAGAKPAPQLRLVPPAAVTEHDATVTNCDDDDGPGLIVDVPPIVDVDRDTWCTPAWIAEAIGKFDLDPCSNERSHIRTKHAFRLDRGEDGLELAKEVPANWRVFCNPPYSRGSVIRWVKAYAHTRFCFLLKVDPSTDWFEELHKITAVICPPKGSRVEFEAPPGVPPDMAKANPFPHALFYAHEDDLTSTVRRRFFVWRPVR